jgi:phosphatidylglycerophosphate synthase
MGKRISHSVLDPWLTLPLKGLYRFLPIPRAFPPEGIVIAGHLFAIAAAVGFAYSTKQWWGGVLVAAGVAGNHVSDCLDGTHARSTNQCRNGGELLDHFFDPLSFSYWLVGMAVSIDRLDLGLAGVICLYATAVLTSIKAKLIGEFTLASFGPTEFKTLLMCYGLLLSALTKNLITGIDAPTIAFWWFVILLGIGILQLMVNLVTAVRDVNRHGDAPDTDEWETTRIRS